MGAHTRGMDEVAWSDMVRTAELNDDRDALGRLFAAGVAAWGHALASDRWFTLMSEADGSAVTG